MADIAPGAIPSPNIWHEPRVYELENRAVDPDGVIEAAMGRIRPWHGATVLDVGCGTGFHLPRFAATAARVIGVEPHAGLAAAARRRVGTGGDATGRARSGNVTVRAGTAQALPLPAASVDIAHARWAYFFGPGCEPGLAELARVLRRGGTAFIIDNDATRSTFGGWFRRWLTSYDPAAVERFWTRQGFTREPLDIRWVFDRRADLAAVLRIEFPAELAEQFLAEHPGCEVDYAVNLWWRTTKSAGASADRWLAAGRPAPSIVAPGPPPAHDVRTARPPKTDRMDRILAATGVVVALITAGTAGCAALGGSPQAAGTGTGAATPAAHTSSPNAATYRRAAECIRTHGLPGFPDPTQNPQTGRWDLPAGTRKPPQSTLNACRSILSQLPETKGDDEDDRPLTAAEMVKAKQFAQCMRQHGLADWPDPGSTGVTTLPPRYAQLGKRGMRPQLEACQKYNIPHRLHMTVDQP
jgi:SAM-dependent methyltransferase